MKCTDKSFMINNTILLIKRRFVKFDFMPTLTVSWCFAESRCGFGNALKWGWDLIHL